MLQTWRLLLIIAILGSTQKEIAEAAEPATATRPIVLKSIGQTFAGAQDLDCLGDGTFVVGRWDGTITVFRPPHSPQEAGPKLVYAASTLSADGVQMVCAVGQHEFVTSNDSNSIASWNLDTKSKPEIVRYDAQYSWATSGCIVTVHGDTLLVTGHESGHLLIWKRENTSWRLNRALSLRSPDPIKWEYQTWHIRAVVPWANTAVVTGSEDGDLCVVSIPDGKVETRQRYNPNAKRGINSVSALGNYVAVGNCSVGDSDKNCWLYRVDEQGFHKLDGVNLRKDTSRPQVFCFAVQLARVDDENVLFASTEEGLLWTCYVQNSSLVADPKPEHVSDGYAAALSFRRDPWTLITASNSIRLFAFSRQASAKAGSGKQQLQAQ